MVSSVLPLLNTSKDYNTFATIVHDPPLGDDRNLITKISEDILLLLYPTYSSASTILICGR